MSDKGGITAGKIMQTHADNERIEIESRYTPDEMEKVRQYLLRIGNPAADFLPSWLKKHPMEARQIINS